MKGKGYRLSKSSILVSLRLTPEVHAILVRRARYHIGGISGYSGDRLTYDLTRKHIGHRNGRREELGLGQRLDSNEKDGGSIPPSRSEENNAGESHGS